VEPVLWKSSIKGARDRERQRGVAGSLKKTQKPHVSVPTAHQVVQVGVFAEEGLALLLLAAHKVLDVHVEAGRRDAV